MPRLTIRKGRHQDTRPFSSWPFIGRSSISRYVTFHESCRYELPAYNSLDVNKLFGLSFGFFAIHRNSARFGWYYDKADDTIVLLAYCYVNGVLNRGEQMRLPEVARVKIGETVKCELEYDAGDGYTFCVHTEHGGFIGCESTRMTGKLPGFGLTHSLYFGGALPAPHDMHVTLAA